MTVTSRVKSSRARVLPKKKFDKYKKSVEVDGDDFLCPFCSAPDCRPSSTPDFETAGEISFEVHCTSCNTLWREWYKLDHVSYYPNEVVA